MLEDKISPSFKYIATYTKNKKVLDLGCGAGNYLKQFSKKSIGVDISGNKIKAARSKGLNVKRADLNRKLPFKDKEFDVIFCSHILEHVNAPINLLKEANRLLKKDGLIVLGVPTEYSIARLFSENYYKGHPTHLYSFSLDCIEQLLKKTGFKRIKTCVNLPLLSKLPFGFLQDLAQLIPKLTVKFSTMFWVIGKK